MNSQKDESGAGQEEFGLEDALLLLEIENVQSLDEAQLVKIRKRAMRRWHPDRITHSDPSPELLSEYETNFKNVETALEIVKSFLNGDLGASLNRKRGGDDETIQPDEAVRKYGPDNQESVRTLWPEVKSSQYEMSEEDVVLTEGITIKEALNADLEDRVPGLAVFALGAGFLIALIAMIVGLIVGVLNSTIGSILLSIIGVAWLVHVAACVLFLLPLSRFWLPAPVTDAIVNIVNATLDATRGWVHDDEGFGRFAHGALSFLAAIVHWLIALPIYKIAGAVFSSKRIGRNVVAIRYYCGFAQQYVDNLLEKDVQAMSLEELMDISNMASQFRHVRGHAA